MRKEAIALIVLVFIVIIGVAFIATIHQEKKDHDYIYKWAKQSKRQVIKIERHYLDLGPYWTVSKYDRLYRADTNKGESFWFLFYPFSTDIEKYPK